MAGVLRLEVWVVCGLLFVATAAGAGTFLSLLDPECIYIYLEFSISMRR